MFYSVLDAILFLTYLLSICISFVSSSLQWPLHSPL